MMMRVVPQQLPEGWKNDTTVHNNNNDYESYKILPMPCRTWPLQLGSIPFIRSHPGRRGTVDMMIIVVVVVMIVTVMIMMVMIIIVVMTTMVTTIIKPFGRSSKEEVQAIIKLHIFFFIIGSSSST